MKEKKISLTIIICTHNRADILFECLNALQAQWKANDLFEIIVVDNASTDHTRKIVDKFPAVRYLFESSTGLSIARNRGYSAASGEWVGYLDDDAIAHPNLIQRVQWIIEHYDFDAFGGVYYPWFKYGQPKWLPKNFGRKMPLRDTVGIITEGFLSGNIMFFKKEILEKCGGFSNHLGMTTKIGYGEDDEVQIRLRNMGFRIGFDPYLAIDHCVMPHKLSVFWHLKSEYAKVRDSGKLGIQYSLRKDSAGFLRSVLALGYKAPKGFYRLLSNDDYYWQNLILDLFIPIVRRIGRISSLLFVKN